MHGQVKSGKFEYIVNYLCLVDSEYLRGLVLLLAFNEAVDEDKHIFWLLESSQHPVYQVVK